MNVRKFIDSRHDADPIWPQLPFQDQIEAEQNERRQIYLDGLEETGRIIPPEEYARRDKGESQLEMMGHRVAERLERLRHKGYHDGDDVYIVGANSRMEKKIPKFRRSNANPYIQRQKRRKIYKSLAIQMQDGIEAGKRYRMWVIHDGPRCHAMNLPKRWSAQAARVSNWNESEFADKWGMRVIFRSAESGSPVRKASKKEWNPEKERWERPYIRDEAGNRIPVRDKQNRQTWHPHSHLIVEKDGYFGPWANFLMWQDGVRKAYAFSPIPRSQALTRPQKLGWLNSQHAFTAVVQKAQNHFATEKLDAGFIHDPREACKYVLKCDELDDVRDIDFLRFLKWTFKRRLVSFYGSAKKRKAQIERDGLQIKSEWDAKTQKTRYVVKKSHHIEVVKKDMEKPWKPPYHGDQCILVAKLDPIPYHTPISEPVFLIRGRVDWQNLEKRKDVQTVLEYSQDGYDAAVEAFPLIYGCTMEEFLNGAPAVTRTPARAELGFDLVENRRAFKRSAHTPPVISRDSPLQCPERGKNEWSEVPVGRAEPVLSSQTTLKVEAEPLGAPNRDQKTELAGSCRALPPDDYGQVCPESFESPEFNAAEYFGV